MVQSFASHSHTSSVRSVAHEKHLLASGGADDRIVIYNLKTRTELYTLDHHNGTVNCLQFTNDASHLISGGADGTLAIVRTGSWQLEKIWDKAHKGSAIIDIAIHSSGKLALTLGGDCTLRTWNLIKGRQAFAVNLYSKSSDPKNLQQIKWAPDGVLFALIGGKYSEIWSIETGGIYKSISHEERVTSCAWMTTSTLVIGYETGQIGIVDIKTARIKLKNAHNSRIKSINTCKEYFITATSSGEVKIWNKKFKEIAKFDTGCRLTCMCILDEIKTEEKETTKAPKVDVSQEQSSEENLASTTNKRNSSNQVVSSKKKKKRNTTTWNIESIN